MIQTNESANRIQRAIAQAAAAGAREIDVLLEPNHAVVTDDRPEGVGYLSVTGSDPDQWQVTSSRMHTHVAPAGCRVTLRDASYSDHEPVTRQLASLDDTMLAQETTNDGAFACRLVESDNIYPVTIVLPDGVTTGAPRPTFSHPTGLTVTSTETGCDVVEKRYSLIAVARQPTDRTPLSSMAELENMMQLLFVRHLRQVNAAGQEMICPNWLTQRDLQDTAQWASPVNPVAEEIAAYLEHMPPAPQICEVPIRERPYIRYVTAPENAVTASDRDQRQHELHTLARINPEFPLTVVRRATGEMPVAAISGARVTFEDGSVRNFDTKSPTPTDDAQWRTDGDRFEQVAEISVNIEVVSPDGNAAARHYAVSSPAWSAHDGQGHLLLYTKEAADDRNTLERLASSWQRIDHNQPESLRKYALSDPDELYGEYAMDRVREGAQAARSKLLDGIAAIVEAYHLDGPEDSEPQQGTSPSGRVTVSLQPRQ